MSHWCKWDSYEQIRKGSGSIRHHTRSARSSFSRIRLDWRVSLPYRCIETRLVMRWLMMLRISLRIHQSLVRREYTSPMIRIVLVVTPPSVLKMMQGKVVRIVANIEVSLLFIGKVGDTWCVENDTFDKNGAYFLPFPYRATVLCQTAPILPSFYRATVLWSNGALMQT